jgi:cell pole-organizing protein PopZ
MEEILASIRRIIESNDPGGSQSVSSTLPPVYGDDEDEIDTDIRLTIDEEDTYAAAEMVAANDSGPEPARLRFGGRDPEKSRNISLADLAARVRSASERVERPSFGGPAAAPRRRGRSPMMTSRMASCAAAIRAGRTAGRDADPSAQPRRRRGIRSRRHGGCRGRPRFAAGR